MNFISLILSYISLTFYYCLLAIKENEAKVTSRDVPAMSSISVAVDYTTV